MPAAESLDNNETSALQEAVAEALPLLPIMKAQLSQTAEQIQQAVVEVCGSFANMAARTQASVTRTAQFLGSQGRGSDSQVDVEKLIQSSQGTLEALLDRLVRVSEQSTRAIGKLHEVDQARARIVTAIAAISRLAKDSKALAMNARIQAARLGRTGAAIGVIADEVASQARESAETTKLMISISDELSGVLGSAVRDLEEMSSLDRQRLQTSREDVERTMRDFRITLDSMRSFIAEMVSEGEKVSSEIFAAVRGLQFQDRANQRISHVTEEMDRMHAKFSVCLGSLPGGSGVSGTLMDDLVGRYTMVEERLTAGAVEDSPSAAGDIELF